MQVKWWLAVRRSDLLSQISEFGPEKQWFFRYLIGSDDLGRCCSCMEVGYPAHGVYLCSLTLQAISPLLAMRILSKVCRGETDSVCSSKPKHVSNPYKNTLCQEKKIRELSFTFSLLLLLLEYDVVLWTAQHLEWNEPFWKNRIGWDIRRRDSILRSPVETQSGPSPINEASSDSKSSIVWWSLD